MRASLLARSAASVAAVAVAANALAEPKDRTKHAAVATLRGKGPEAAREAARDALAVNYLSGKQAMVGWHAPSTTAVSRDSSGRPMLALSTVNRGESLAIPVVDDGARFAAVDLDHAARVLRAATGDEHPIDPRTLSLVYRIQTHFDVPEIRVVSGYRVPRPGSHSNHGKGRAMDIIVPGVADEEVARFAREIGFVGVGVYPSSQFVHVDIRPRSYFWIDFSGPRMKNRERGILGDLAAKSDAAAIARGQEPIEPFDLVPDVDAALRARGLAGAGSQVADDGEDED